LLDIRTLGGFAVRRGDGNVISDAQWAGNRQKLLLKAIVVNGCREIPKDVLMDALWPESSADAALKRFKVTLHRLRRILEPDLSQNGGSSCISLKDSLINLDMLRCRVDVNAFLAVCDKIRQLKRDEEDDRLLSACRRAVDIYKGDFLHEEPYLSWAETKRAALRDRYLAVLMDLAGLCESNGMIEEAARHYSAVISGRSACRAGPSTTHAPVSAPGPAQRRHQDLPGSDPNVIQRAGNHPRPRHDPPL
jgi:LuxR family maltose regulon positive regulatory protein